MLKLELDKLSPDVTQAQLSAMAGEVAAAHQKLYDPSAPGADFTGWVRLPQGYDRQEFARIQQAAAQIRADSDVLVVVGIGGSYLGARAALEIFPSDGPEICFVGCSLSPNETQRVLDRVQDRRWSLNVISKSGGTTEPAIAFRLFRQLLERQYGSQANRRIYATTDQARGALKALADHNGWQSFVIPDAVGGRFSVLTAVGLLPIAVGGTDIAQLMAGAAQAMADFDRRDMDNPVWQYVAARNLLYRQGKRVELFCSYEPAYACFGEWLKQLFGESEGKDGKGLFPASAQFTTDLHSLGQYIQDGERLLLETVLYVDDTGCDLPIPHSEDDGDNLNYLAGKPLSFVREMAFQGTLNAHREGGVPALVVRLPRMDAHALGQLFYFFELSCGISGHVLGVNPFNQPGVEAYKKKMFALLGRP
ncbi:MAG TPA: glucose-6-phosphate isomerase [Candidatus Enterenecus merdae]|nr:glucose-6-phosphate isomerase [Candidatus Enterenecus merdae]